MRLVKKVRWRRQGPDPTFYLQHGPKQAPAATTPPPTWIKVSNFTEPSLFPLQTTKHNHISSYLPRANLEQPASYHSHPDDTHIYAIYVLYHRGSL
jgi:hypothetical protein